MKRAIFNEFERLGEYLSNYNAIFAYRLMNLCVKAEEVSLLPIEVLVEGEVQNLEKCTTIGKKDDYSFMIFPNFDEDLPSLAYSITRAHPEFKQEILSMKVDSADITGKTTERDVRYILVTMPEVDDNRYDVLKDGLKVCYEDCKAQMEAANVKAKAKIAEFSVGESEEDINNVKKGLEQLNDQWYGQRDRLYNEKLQEIEEAHNKWLREKAKNNQLAAERAAARGEDVVSSMRMTPDDMGN